MGNSILFLFSLWFGTLPPAHGKAEQPGIAGPFVGSHKDVLIIAGGANFEEGYPWNDGKRIYKADIYIGREDEKGDLQWKTLPDSFLPVKTAYGVSIDTPEGVWCIGGLTPEGISNEVYRLSWNSEISSVQTEKITELPQGFLVISGTKINDLIYLHGIKDTRNVLLSIEISSGQIRRLDACPGGPRESTVMEAQSDGNETCIYLIGGRTVNEKEAIIHTDVWAYSPEKNQWVNKGSISPPGSDPVSVMGATSLPWDNDKIIIFGGDDGKEFMKRFNLEKSIRKSTNKNEQDILKSQLKESFIQHPGFTNQLFLYNTITNKWNLLCNTKEKLPVCTKAMKWKNKIIIPSGEIRPGIRTEKVAEISF